MSGEHALAHVKNPSVFTNVAPTAARRFALHFSLRCRAHDQFTAEQTFGREFMENKREEARQAAERAKELDVIPWLRKLGIRADEAQRLSTLCESIPDASIEERLKYALSCLDTRARLRQPAAA